MFEFIMQCPHCKKENRIIFNFSSKGRFKCGHCQDELGQATAINGYVYLLSNTSMPGLVKVGFTRRTVEERLKELNGTNLPTPFIIEAVFTSSIPELDEEKCHQELAEFRVSNKEFFKVEIDFALEAMEKILEKKASYKLNTSGASGWEEA